MEPTDDGMEPVPVEYPLGDLGAVVSVRAGLNGAHVERLVEVLDVCPPVVVSDDGTLLDGLHRVEAARRLGRTTIPAVVVPVTSPGDALIVAVRANCSHGLPLTRGERRAALRHLLETGDHRSDRALAEICGLSRSTVAAARKEAAARSAGSSGHLNREGVDGKRYPASHHHNAAALASAHVRIEPAIRVRELADRVGVSVGTAHRLKNLVLDQLRQERWLVRHLRRLQARFFMWRRKRSDRP